MDRVKIEEAVRQMFSQYITRDFKNTDDFFKLGANSLQAAQVVIQIEKTFRIQVSDAEVKNLRTVASLSDFVFKKLG